MSLGRQIHLSLSLQKILCYSGPAVEDEGVKNRSARPCTDSETSVCCSLSLLLARLTSPVGWMTLSGKVERKFISRFCTVL